MANFCAECGTRSEGGKFCTSCGFRLVDGTDQSPPAPSPTSSTVNPRWAVQSAENNAPRLQSTPSEVEARSTNPAASALPAAEQTVVRPVRRAPEPPAAGPRASAAAREAQPSQQPLPPPYAAPFHGGPQAGMSPPGMPVPSPAVVPPREPLANPFAGMPIGDYVRDAGAIVCLLSAFGMAWDSTSDGSDHWWVVISALLSLISLAVPYVVKANLVPGLGPDAGMLVKLGLNAPVALSVVAAAVADVLQGTGDGGGIGFGVAVIATGAALAVQPRDADRPAALAGDALWWKAACVAGVATVMLMVAALLAAAVADATSDFSMIEYALPTFLALIAMIVGVSVILVAVPVSGLVGRQIADARVLGTVGLTTVGVFMLIHADAAGFNTATVHRWFVIAPMFFVLGALGALAVSPAVLRVTADSYPARGWVLTARRALVVSIAGSVLNLVVLAGFAVIADAYSSGVIAALVLLAAAPVLGGLAFVQISGDTLNRLTVVLLTGGVMVAGLIAMTVLASAFPSGFGLGVLDAVVYFTLPALAIAALTAPASVRAAYGPLVVQSQPGPPR